MALMRKVASASPILLLASLMIYQTCLLLINYNEGLTFMANSFVSQTDTQFPEITYCPKSIQKSMPAFRRAFNISSANWKSQISSKEMFERATVSNVTELMNGFYVRFFEENPNTSSFAWTYDKAEFPKVNSYFMKRSHPIYGQCVTFKRTEFVLRFGLYYSILKPKLNEKFNIVNFIHKSSNFWHATFFRPGITTNFGEVSQVQVNYEEVHQMATDRFSCTNVGRDECFESQVQARILKGPGCLPPWFDLSDMPYCNGTRDILEADAILQTAIANFERICLPSCDYLVVTSGSRTHEKRGNSEMRAYLYFPFKVEYRVETLLMDLLKLVAEIGGYAGILLGISCIHLTSLVNYIIDWMIRK